jgi:tetratricopeptide (TPR) repeat protein
MARLAFPLLLLLANGILGQAHAAPTGDAGMPADNDQQDRDGKLERFKAILARYPADPDANFNVGVIYQLKEKPALALRHFQTALKADADDWHSVAKLVQVNQALGNLEARDRSRARLLALYQANKVVYPDGSVATVYCRDQFPIGKYWVMALESFELIGPRAVRYRFNILSKPEGGQDLRSITLGSYAVEQPGALQRGDIGPGERLFHLDGAWPNGTQVRYGVFRNEPDYDVLRKKVLALLQKELPSGVGPPQKP